MKQRHGFVSNSSSSSFIIGIGVVAVEDKDALLAMYPDFLTKDDRGYYKVPFDEMEVSTVGELIEAGRTDSINVRKRYNSEEQIAEIESFMYNTVEVSLAGLDPEDLIIGVYQGGCCCESVFFSDEDDDDDDCWGCDEPNHDIDYEDLYESAQDAMDFFHEPFVKNGMSTFGAGRNG